MLSLSVRVYVRDCMYIRCAYMYHVMFPFISMCSTAYTEKCLPFRTASRGLCCYIANTHYCYIYNLLPRAHLTTSIAFTTPSISLQLDADLIHVLSTQSVDTYTSRHGAVATPSPWREQSCEESRGEFWLCQVILHCEECSQQLGYHLFCSNQI